MHVKLKTDFIDYYDFYFDLVGDITLERIAGHDALTSYPGKAEQFRLLLEMGELVIPNAPVLELINLTMYKPLVVYLEDWRHAGNGKELMSPGKASQLYPDHLASVYVRTALQGSVSFKYLQLGDIGMDMKVTSLEDWRTNVETYEVEMLDIYPATRPRYTRPVYAIDYVEPLGGGPKYAVDLNHAPGCRGLGIKDYLDGPDVVKAIKRWYEHT